MTTTARLLGLMVLCLALASPPSEAQVLHAVELTSTDFAKLDRSKSVIILPGGILEEHGPYLPIFSDGFLNERLTDSLAASIAARPGWKAIIFPLIPLGNSGANDIGGRFSFSGTYTVRFETLRDVFMDLADEIGSQGFRWVFVVHLHGAPNHSRALDEAGDYFHHQFGGRMVHLAGLMPVFSALEGSKSAAEKRMDGLPVHSGMDETSLIRFLKPPLVRKQYRAASDVADSTMDGLIHLAQSPSWQGYFGAPRLATRAHGAKVWRALTDSAAQTAIRILNGFDPARIERYSTVMAASAPDVALDEQSRAAEAARAARQRAWLRSKQRP